MHMLVTNNLIRLPRRMCPAPPKAEHRSEHDDEQYPRERGMIHIRGALVQDEHQNTAISDAGRSREQQ